MKRLRVASLQYYFRPISSYTQFKDQIEALVDTAHDYDCGLMVFPEYFTAQLLTLGDVKRPIDVQIRSLAREVPRYIETMQAMAKGAGIYICAGSIPTLATDGDTLYNDSYFFGPTGDYGIQGKLHMTRWEREEWRVSPRDKLKVFDTEMGRLAIAICYDVEFPEIARAAAHEGAKLLLVPSCTDDRQGYWRVRYCAQARAIENQMYVVHASTVGSIPQVPAVHLNYGQAGIYTPSDYTFARDGIQAEGVPNQESMVMSDLDLETIEQSREFGTVLPLNDSRRTRRIVAEPDIIKL
jgi:predicted amidohydrolase